MHTPEYQSELLSLAHKSSKSGIWDWDMSGDTVFFDPNYYRIAGYEPNEFPHKFEEWEKRIHPDDLLSTQKALQRYMDKNAESYSAEFRFKTKAGGWMWILTTGQFTGRDENGNPTRFTGLHVDISETKNTEQALKKERAFSTSLINTAQLIILVLDVEGRIQQINPYMEAITGYKEAEVKGKDWFDTFLPPADHTEIRAMFKKAIVNIDVNGQANPIMAKDGRRLMIEWHSKTLKGIDGTIIGLLSFGIDIAERIQSEIALRESEKHLQLVFENAPVALFQEDFSEVKIQIDLLRQEGVSDFQTYLESHPEVVVKCATKVKIIDVNRAALKLHNANTTKELLEGLYETFTEESYKAFCNELVALANGADNFHTEATVQTLDGEIREVLLRFFIDLNKTDWSCVYVSLTDITNRKKAEQERLDLEVQLRQKHKMEAVGLMAGGMAHNFNNNLSIILGNLEMAQRKTSEPEKTKGYIDNAKTASLRSRDLVQQIQIYSRNTKNETIPVFLPQAIEETIKLFRSTLPSTVNLQQTRSCDVTIDADPSQLQEVLINLCNNAIHAMNEKGDLTISLEVVELTQDDIPAQYPCFAGKYAKIRVQDTGSGMTAETLEKIFDPFFSTKGVGKGTGMGLSTVHGIVDQHKGLIKVTSESGVGTTFDLYFPVTEKTEEVQDLTVPSLPTGTEKILFLDDEKMLADIWSKMLREYGYQVTSVTNSTKALKLFKEKPERFDLVISDQTMPELSGKEFLKELLSIRPELPTILCTGHTTQINEKKAKQIGIKAFCMKPLDLPTLLQTTRQVLDGEKDQ